MEGTLVKTILFFIDGSDLAALYMTDQEVFHAISLSLSQF